MSHGGKGGGTAAMPPSKARMTSAVSSISPSDHLNIEARSERVSLVLSPLFHPPKVSDLWSIPGVFASVFHACSFWKQCVGKAWARWLWGLSVKTDLK